VDMYSALLWTHL